jgi:hypothetical protein
MLTTHAIDRFFMSINDAGSRSINREKNLNTCAVSVLGAVVNANPTMIPFKQIGEEKLFAQVLLTVKLLGNYFKIVIT